MNNYICAALIFFISLPLYAENALPKEDLQKTINYLLEFVGKSDVTFIRNDESRTSQEAVKHMKDKYEHFKNEIKTPEDFIRLAGTKSLTTGQPYRVKIKEGKEILSNKWLTDALEAYHKTKD